MSTRLKLLTLIIFALISLNSKASVHAGRLGLGYSNQFVNNLPAVSFKLQKSPVMALGGMLAYSNEDVGGGYGAGLKIYRLIFDEPFLNFYGSILGALVKKNISTTRSESGFQFDFTFGSEFTFRGIESIGFSFEFGVSLNKVEDLVIETTGNSFITAGVHFYL